MVKVPKNLPEVGNTVLLRGRGKKGKLVQISHQEIIDSYWCNVLWENHDGPSVCHLHELEKIDA